MCSVFYLYSVKLKCASTLNRRSSARGKNIKRAFILCTLRVRMRVFVYSYVSAWVCRVRGMLYVFACMCACVCMCVCVCACVFSCIFVVLRMSCTEWLCSDSSSHACSHYILSFISHIPRQALLDVHTGSTFLAPFCLNTLARLFFSKAATRTL